LQALQIRGTQSAGNDYQRWLPSFNLAIKPNDQVVIRAATNVTTTMAGYYDLRATETSGVSTTNNANNVPAAGGNPAVQYPAIFTGFTANRGNTALKPTTGINFDLSLEYYQSSNFNVHVAGFHKILKDLILFGSVQRPFSRTFQRANGTSQTVTGNILADEIYNAGEKSYVSGVEVGGRKYFNELPAPFEGLGVEANFTYIDSKSPGALAYDINGVRINDLPIVGLSKYNYNVQLLYDRKQLSMRAAYSWRSKYLQTTTGNGTNSFYSVYPDPTTGAGAIRTRYSLPVYADAYGQLDAGITYTVNPNFRINVQGQNLTNAVTRTLMGGYPGGSQIRSWFISDSRYEVGVSVAF
jgi:TonB-dependent receptor